MIISKRLKDSEEDLIKKIDENIETKRKVLGADLLDHNEIVETAKLTFTRKLATEIEKLQKEHEAKVKKLEAQLQKYKPEEIKTNFPAGWHNKIRLITIEFFIIRVKSYIGTCGYCMTFEAMGYLDQLTSLYKQINLPEEKWNFVLWSVDQADRFMSPDIDENYENRLSTEGMNWFYAKGKGIITFPAFIIRIDFNPIGNKTSRPKMKRVMGIGDKDGEDYYFGLIESVIEFLRTQKEDALSGIGKHKEKSQYNDMSENMKDNKHFNQSIRKTKK